MNDYYRQPPTKVVDPVPVPCLLGLIFMVLLYGTIVVLLRGIFGIDNR